MIAGIDWPRYANHRGTHMIALSIRQPWASAIVTGLPGAPVIHKDVENRAWPTPYRGRCLIHASKSGTRREFDEAVAGIEQAFGIPQAIRFDDLPRGGIIGQVEIFDCVETSDSPWFEGPFGFLLRAPRVLPFRELPGRLGFFNVQAEVAS